MISEEFNYDNFEKVLVSLIESESNHTHYDFYHWIDLTFTRSVMERQLLPADLDWLLEYAEYRLESQAHFTTMTQEQKQLVTFKHSVLTDLFYHLCRQRKRSETRQPGRYSF